MDDPRILDKIKKCLALSQSSEPHEAAAALRQAQKLMEAHGVDQLQLKLADIGEAQIRSGASATKPKDWETQLLALVGKAFGCKLLWTSHYPYGYFTYIGLKAQVTLAEYTVQVLQRRLLRGRAAFVAGLSPYFSRGRKTQEADGFCHGWVGAVSKTVHAFALAKETEDLIDHVKAQRSKGTQKVQARQAGYGGLVAGQKAGASETIHRPVNEQERLRLK